MTQAIILAAGRGSRMLHWTDSKPKCLIPLAGKTLLEWQTEALQRAGIHDLFLVTGYLAPMLTNKGFPYFFNKEWQTTNMVQSLFTAEEILTQKDTIISYSDIIYNDQIIKDLMQKKADICIAYDLLWKELWQQRFEAPLTDAESFSIIQDRVLEVGKKPETIEKIQGQYMGLLKITPQGWAKMKSIQNQIDKKIDMTTFLQRLIEMNIEIEGVPTSGKWCEIDSPSDLDCYEKKFKENISWSHNPS